MDWRRRNLLAALGLWGWVAQVAGEATATPVASALARQLASHGARPVLPVGIVGLNRAASQALVEAVSGQEAPKADASGVTLVASSGNDDVLLAVLNAGDAEAAAVPTLSLALGLARPAPAGLVWRLAYADVVRGNTQDWMLQRAFQRSLAAGSATSGAKPNPLVLLVTGAPEAAPKEEVEDFLRNRVKNAFTAAARSPVKSFEDAFDLSIVFGTTATPDADTIKAVAQALRPALTRDLSTASAASAAAAAIAAANEGAERLAGADAGSADKVDLKALLAARKARAVAALTLETKLAGLTKRLGTGELDASFGESAREAVAESQLALKAAAGGFEQTPEVQAVVSDFRRAAFAQLEPLFRLQLSLLRRQALQQFQADSPQKPGAGFKGELSKAVSGTRRFFSQGAQELVPAGSGWSYAMELAELQSVLSENAELRLQVAQVQAKTDGTGRSPISLSIHMHYPDLGLSSLPGDRSYFGSVKQPNVAFLKSGTSEEGDRSWKRPGARGLAKSLKGKKKDEDFDDFDDLDDLEDD